MTSIEGEKKAMRDHHELQLKKIRNEKTQISNKHRASAGELDLLQKEHAALKLQHEEDKAASRALENRLRDEHRRLKEEKLQHTNAMKQSAAKLQVKIKELHDERIQLQKAHSDELLEHAKQRDIDLAAERKRVQKVEKEDHSIRLDKAVAEHDSRMRDLEHTLEEKNHILSELATRLTGHETTIRELKRTLKQERSQSRAMYV